jgi:hypothetical protein
MLEKIVNFLEEYGFEIAWFSMGFFLNEFFMDATIHNWSGALFDVVLVLLLMWSVKENYDE